MPPLQALVALHVFWVLLLLPAVAAAVYQLSPGKLRLLGWVLSALGILGLAIVAIHEALDIPPEYRYYLPQRILFVLATSTDVPIVQVVSAGLVCLIASRISVRES
jgi:hypothetical protein